MHRRRLYEHPLGSSKMPYVIGCQIVNRHLQVKEVLSLDLNTRLAF
jgi:hypothetical protein